MQLLASISDVTKLVFESLLGRVRLYLPPVKTTILLRLRSISETPVAKKSRISKEASRTKALSCL